MRLKYHCRRLGVCRGFRPVGRPGQRRATEKARVLQPRPHRGGQPRRERPHPHQDHRAEALLSRPRHRAAAERAQHTDYADNPTSAPTDVLDNTAFGTNISPCPARSRCRGATIPGSTDRPTPSGTKKRGRPAAFFVGEFQARGLEAQDSFSSSSKIAEPISAVETVLRARRRRCRRCAGPVERGGDRLLDHVGLFAHVERIAQRHAERGDHGDRIGDALAGDVGRRAVHRLVQRLALLGLGIDLAERSGSQHAERAGRAWRRRRTACRRTGCR